MRPRDPLSRGAATWKPKTELRLSEVACGGLVLAGLNSPNTTEMNATEEIPELAKMLHATATNDAPRLLAISKRVAEIAEAAPCANCEHPGPETFQNGAWRCPECFGMGWVPSKTEADTDPCPKCEGGFKSPGENAEVSHRDRERQPATDQPTNQP